jgi:LemA protein
MTTGRVLLAGIAALLLFWGIGAYNRLVRLRSAAVAGWAPVDAELRRRQALAFELAETLAELEPMGDGLARAALQSVVAATRQAQAAVDHAQVRPCSAGAIQSLGLAEGVLEGALRPLRVLVESRAARLDESAQQRLQALHAALQESDAQLGFARRVFNEAIAAFNAAVHEWPTRLIASLFGFVPAARLQQASPERGPDSQLGSSFGERT